MLTSISRNTLIRYKWDNRFLIFSHTLSLAPRIVNLLSTIRLNLSLYGYIKTICQDHECHLLQIGGISNHIHLLVNLSRKHALSKFVNEIKSHSSKWIKTIDNDSQNFAWQAGYGAFSVGQLEYQKVIDYISKQKEHHKVISFQDEYLRFLKTYGMKYDEKYLWE